jgi:hypothetical protein
MKGTIMADVISDQEQEIIDLVVKALPRYLVTAKPITVHTLEGGESSTLRFTADDVSSTDLKRDRIASGAESPESLAAAVEQELLAQLPAR